LVEVLDRVEVVEFVEAVEFVDVREEFSMGGRTGAADALVEASAEALAVPGYWIVFEGAVDVEFKLFDGTGFDDERAGFRGSAAAGWVTDRGGLPEDMPR
jgi:hypothetical protein